MRPRVLQPSESLGAPLQHLVSIYPRRIIAQQNVVERDDFEIGRAAPVTGAAVNSAKEAWAFSSLKLRGR